MMSIAGPIRRSKAATSSTIQPVQSRHDTNHTADRSTFNAILTGFPLFYSQEIQDFPGGPQWKIFQDLFVACECLNVKKNGIYLRYSECSPLQKIQHGAKCGRQLFRIQMNLFPCFPFEPLEKCTTFKAIFSRTLSFNFQDFPGPKWFSRTF